MSNTSDPKFNLGPDRNTPTTDVAVGRVTLVGAGPGDPDLLTVSALRALRLADVVMFDTLVSAPVLDLIGAQAERVHVGKRGYGDTRPQAQINAKILTFARAGRHVVRLKAGDPLIFGRAGEEIEACHAAQIPIEVIPGITAAQGAAAKLRVSLTHRNEARRLQYLTGHDANAQIPSDIDWSAIADPQSTTIVYMPRRTIEGLAQRALAAGIDPDTPAIVVINATRPDEIMARTTMAGIVDSVRQLETTAPTLVMIGRCLARAALPSGQEISHIIADAKGAA